jgi:hypothetical protein
MNINEIEIRKEIKRIRKLIKNKELSEYEFTCKQAIMFELHDILLSKYGCDHMKQYDFSTALLTYPTKYKWKCIKCGKTGTDVMYSNTLYK